MEDNGRVVADRASWRVIFQVNIILVERETLLGRRIHPTLDKRGRADGYSEAIPQITLVTRRARDVVAM